LLAASPAERGQCAFCLATAEQGLAGGKAEREQRLSGGGTGRRWHLNGLTMQRIMLRSKIHRVKVTQADLDYEGSCGIDENLLEAADIKVFEKIELYNVNNGQRFSTYAIRGKRGSGEISLNGAAARCAQLGDLLIICTYAPMNEEEAASYSPKIVFVGDQNQITGLKK
jgi:aspartate 1-decarboxylase